MKHWYFYNLLSAVALACDGGGSGYCPIRFKDTNACACSIDQAPSLDRAQPVTCYDVSNYEIRIQPCYCMYYDSTQNLSIVGHCIHSCYHYSGTVIKVNSIVLNSMPISVRSLGTLIARDVFVDSVLTPMAWQRTPTKLCTVFRVKIMATRTG